MDDFTVTVTGTYTREEIPPRCRKPRPVTYDTRASATVSAASSQEAPVAFRISRVIPEGAVDEIRTHDGKLYAPYKPEAHQQDLTIAGDSRFPSEVHEGHHLTGYGLSRATSAEEFTATVSDRFARFLIIDGAVWSETSEPYYTVATFGMGGNHGGTGLMVGGGGQVFRADEFEAARACAIETAAERGDTKDVARFERDAEHYRAIEVLIPEAVTLVTVPPTPRHVRDLQWSYRLARGHLEGADTPEDEAEAFGQVASLREQIIEAGHAPVQPDVRPYEARHHPQEG